MVFVRTEAEIGFFVADLRDGGKRLDNVRRLGLGANEYVHAWTPDSQAVVFESNRNGAYNIFKQGLSQRAPEPLVTGKDDTVQGRFSPDGQWLFYVLRKSPEFSLMRMPAAGGVPELILSAPPWRRVQLLLRSRARERLCGGGKRSEATGVLSL
jgi:Tol biopolymer transport system component